MVCVINLEVCKNAVFNHCVSKKLYKKIKSIVIDSLLC
jgi:hypothetical protein